jgi:prepilin-type N-terminal cleavage/methylation domain-containing protein
MKKAFSLIELSIVILIIGILVAGVTQSSRLTAQFRLQTARNLTINSPLSSIKGLTTWYETSLESSFGSISLEDGTAIDTWNDINPQSSYKNNSTQSTTNRKPYFRENAINGLPAIRFFDTAIDATGDRLDIDLSMLVASSYTIFIVEQRRSDGGYIFGSSSDGTATRFGYGSSAIGLVQDAKQTFLSVATYSSSQIIKRMHSMSYDYETTKDLSYWLNGGTTPDSLYDSPDVASPTSLPNMVLGYHSVSGGDYSGDIAEIIIFTRLLKTEERQEIEKYLSKKYAIPLS